MRRSAREVPNGLSTPVRQALLDDARGCDAHGEALPRVAGGAPCAFLSFTHPITGQPKASPNESRRRCETSGSTWICGRPTSTSAYGRRGVRRLRHRQRNPRWALAEVGRRVRPRAPVTLSRAAVWLFSSGPNRREVRRPAAAGPEGDSGAATPSGRRRARRVRWSIRPGEHR